MFMHMPKKLGIPVMIAVAVALGAYYIWVMRPGTVGNWTIYQGTGKEIAAAGEEPRVDISYTVRQPARPLFRCSYSFPKGQPGPDNVAECYGPFEITFSYRSEWPTTLRIVRTDRDGSVWEADLAMEHSDEWKTMTLGGAAFKRRAAAETLRGASVDSYGFRVAYDFYDGSGVMAPSTRFSNRISFRQPSIRPY